MSKKSRCNALQDSFTLTYATAFIKDLDSNFTRGKDDDSKRSCLLAAFSRLTLGARPLHQLDKKL